MYLPSLSAWESPRGRVPGPFTPYSILKGRDLSLTLPPTLLPTTHSDTGHGTHQGQGQYVRWSQWGARSSH